MAVITPDTFDPLRSYISVRLLQGVPLVDADWNEAHDVRKFEVQAFLKWFVGNGVPEGNDGFRIAGLTAVVVRDDLVVWDFVMQCGVGAAPAGTNNVEWGLRHVGRCLVDGMDVLIAKDIHFRAQPLHVSQEGSTAQARLLGVPTIAEIPVSDDPVVVYLDVWERLVTSDEEPRLKHRGLGVESCARLKREWVVRTRAGSSVPTPNNPNHPNDFIAGHSYYALATIAHRAGVPITGNAIIDQRERRLLMPPATLIEDVFGPVDYRRGQGRPLINLREAINALLRGELPSSPEFLIAPSPGSYNFPGEGTFFDNENGLITIWTSTRAGTSQIFAARLWLAMPDAGFGAAQQITGGPNLRRPHATLLHTGEVLIVYETMDGVGNILMKRGTLANLHPESPEKVVAATTARERHAFVVTVGMQVLILWHKDAGNTWQFRRYDVETDSFLGEAADLSTIVTGQLDLHAARDSKNTVWVAFNTIDGFVVVSVPPDAPPNPPEQLGLPLGGSPFVMVDNDDNVWVFWFAGSAGGPTGIWYRRLRRATMTWEPVEQVRGTTRGQQDRFPAAVSDAEGGVWVFWMSRQHDHPNIWYVRQNPVTQAWSEPLQITGQTEADSGSSHPFVLYGRDGSLWLFSDRSFEVTETSELLYRRIFPSI